MENFYFELMKRFDWYPPPLDAVKDMEIDDPDFINNLTKIEELEKKIENLGQITDEDLRSWLRREELRKEYEQLNKQTLNIGSMIASDDLKNMRRVLRRLDMVSDDEVVRLKGKIASEITAANEVIVTELLVEGYIQKLEPEVIAALGSGLVFTEGKGELVEPKNPVLSDSYQKLVEIIKKVAAVLIEGKIDLNEEEFVNSFKPDMMEVTYKWGKGKKFEDICKMTEIYEGTIIRVFRRLEELLKQLSLVSKTQLDNHDLHQKIESVMEKLKRGIVFASSLYL